MTLPQDRQPPEQELARLKARVQELEAELEQYKGRAGDLDKQLSAERAERQVIESTPPISPTPDLEQTLGRLVKRIAMILQAEKCVFMLHDPEAGELVAQRPAVGLSDEQVKVFRVRATHGASGEAFRDAKPVVLDDAVGDPRTVKENVALLNIRNIATVPLVMETRDEQERVVEKKTIGVLHVFNKRFGGMFSDEDVRLLTIMARQAAAVIASAQLYIELKQEKDKLEATLESILAGVMVVDMKGKVTLVNQAGRRMLGLTQEGEISAPLDEVIPDERIRELVKRSMTSQKESAAEIEVKKPAERVYQGQTTLIRDETGQPTGVVAIFNDISEIRNVERMKSAFVATVSPELRTPLTGIKGFISTLLSDTEGFFDDESRREFYTIIDQECDRLTRLISDLLNVSAIESGRALEVNYTPVDPTSLIEKTVSVQRSYTDKHELRVEIPERLPRIMADEEKLERILTNLMNNATKYSPHGGEVVVRAVREGDSIVVAVRDQGIGVSKDKQTKIFERFERVDTRDTREAGGAGIGLFLVKHMIEAHGGTIGVESEVGNGSTFTFSIPVEPKRAGGGGGSA